MTPSLKLSDRLDWTLQAVRFFRHQFTPIFGLGLVAALGRAAQLGAFGPIATELNRLLEVAIETARLLIFLYALGLTNVKTGLANLARLVTDQPRRRQMGQLARQKLRTGWASLLLNLMVFSAIAWGMNLLINHIAYQTCLYAKLQAGQIIAEQASEWTIILFFKNLSVIPFTLVFNAFFLLWLVSRLPAPALRAT